jgi:signal transduction histidine kinase
MSAVSIFFLNESFRKEEFQKRVVLEGIESIELFFSTPVPTSNIIQDLNKNAANSLQKEKIYIYDSVYNLLYSTPGAPAPSLTPEKFKIARKQEIFTFSDNGTECALISRTIHNQQCFVLAAAYDVFGRRKGENLKVLLSASVLIGLLVSGFLAFFYVRHAMRPLEELKGQIEKINEKNLKERVAVGNSNTEVWQIARKFNDMLERLEQAFEQRKNFVQHASHELRTPLANMLLQTESALGKNMSVQEYHTVLLSLKEDQQDLIDLTNSLLTLSRYEKLSFVSDSFLIRIDEVLYETVEFAEKTWPGSMVTINFATVPQNQSELEFRGNEFLIKSAVQNLVKNGIYYSADKKVRITILFAKKGLILYFENVGKQLSLEEQGKLFIPFFRGENANNKKGYGLGLSIVERIIHLHNGNITYQCIESDINRFTIYLPVR